jgi:hypothetical protein
MFEVFIVYDRDGDVHQPKSLERDNKPQVVALLQPVDGKLPADELLPLVVDILREHKQLVVVDNNTRERQIQ